MSAQYLVEFPYVNMFKAEKLAGVPLAATSIDGVRSLQKDIRARLSKGGVPWEEQTPEDRKVSRVLLTLWNTHETAADVDTRRASLEAEHAIEFFRAKVIRIGRRLEEMKATGANAVAAKLALEDAIDRMNAAKKKKEALGPALGTLTEKIKRVTGRGVAGDTPRVALHRLHHVLRGGSLGEPETAHAQWLADQLEADLAHGDAVGDEHAGVTASAAHRFLGHDTDTNSEESDDDDEGLGLTGGMKRGRESYMHMQAERDAMEATRAPPALQPADARKAFDLVYENQMGDIHRKQTDADGDDPGKAYGKMVRLQNELDAMREQALTVPPGLAEERLEREMGRTEKDLAAKTLVHGLLEARDRAGTGEHGTSDWKEKGTFPNTGSYHKYDYEPGLIRHTYDQEQFRRTHRRWPHWAHDGLPWIDEDPDRDRISEAREEHRTAASSAAATTGSGLLGLRGGSGEDDEAPMRKKFSLYAAGHPPIPSSHAYTFEQRMVQFADLLRRVDVVIDEWEADPFHPFVDKEKGLDSLQMYKGMIQGYYKDAEASKDPRRVEGLMATCIHRFDDLSNTLRKRPREAEERDDDASDSEKEGEDNVDVDSWDTGMQYNPHREPYTNPLASVMGSGLLGLAGGNRPPGVQAHMRPHPSNPQRAWAVRTTAIPVPSSVITPEYNDIAKEAPIVPAHAEVRYGKAQGYRHRWFPSFYNDPAFHEKKTKKNPY